MPNPFPPPPIASPDGNSAPVLTPQPDEKCLRLAVSLGLKPVLRYAMNEWLTPFTLGALLFFPLLLALISFPIEFRRWGWAAFPLMFSLFLAFIFVFSSPIGLFVRLCSKRRFQICLSEAGVFKCYPRRNIFFPWSKFTWVIERNGDLWLASFMDGCFIPRESFASSEQSHQLATIIRELKQGAPWRPEWESLTFSHTSIT